MASYEANYISGGNYKAPAGKTVEQPFWWPGGTAKDYFDVAIWPDGQTSLWVKTKRMIFDGEKYVILLGIVNEGHEDVTYTATIFESPITDRLWKH